MGHSTVPKVGSPIWQERSGTGTSIIGKVAILTFIHVPIHGHGMYHLETSKSFERKSQVDFMWWRGRSCSSRENPSLLL
jgi:hypothetical protein